MLQQHHELARQVAQLQLEVSRRDDMIHAMLHSTSWRLTAPIRLFKVQVRQGARLMWRVSRPAVARAARVSRPLMRVALRAPGVRAALRIVAGPQTRIGRRARAFLFPAAMMGVGDSPPVAMTESAEAMEGRLRAAIEHKSSR
jgi:hypothetical protein